MGTHLDGFISNCASSIHALRMLRTHGLPLAHAVSRGRPHDRPLLSGICLAGMVFTSAHDRDRLEHLVEILRRGRVPARGCPLICGDGTKADKSLFRSIITNPGHVLYRHLPKVKTTGYNLCTGAHAFELPEKDDRNFISRLLFPNIY